MSLSPYVSPEGVARASRLLELSERLASSGRRGEALDAAREASEIHRGLSVLAVRLHEARRIREGVAISRETVRIRRRLTQRNYDAHAPGLAESLGRLAVELSAAGELRDALATAQESVEL